MIRYLGGFLIGYLFGSVPTAFIFVKAFKGIDIRKVGSGNVGALNAYEVSGSALIGISVLLIDILKGVFSIKVSQALFGGDEVVALISGFSAVLGHNFSIWISFYGGRGLATSLGVFAVVNPFLILVWCALWAIAYVKVHNIHVGNIWATVFTPAVVVPALKFFNSLSYVKVSDKALLIFVISISALIFIKHFKPLLQLIRDGKILQNKFQKSDA